MLLNNITIKKTIYTSLRSWGGGGGGGANCPMLSRGEGMLCGAGMPKIR